MASSSPGANGAPSSTIGLFTTILRSASVDTSEAGSRLFPVVTKLVKLELLNGKDPTDHAQAEHKDEVWDKALEFLTRYPAYILFQAPPLENGQSDYAESSDDAHVSPDPMVICMLPAMLKRLGQLAIRPNAAPRKALLLEDWLVGMVDRLVTSFYAENLGGIRRQREVLRELTAILHRLRPDVLAQSPMKWPLSLLMFEKGAALRRSENQDPFANANGAQQEHRPFTLTIDSSSEAVAIRWTIVKILVRCIVKGSAWAADIMPEMISALVGDDNDWLSPKLAKGKKRADSVLISVSQRLQQLTKLLSASNPLALCQVWAPRIIKRIFQALVQAAHPAVDDVENAQDSTDTYIALLGALSALSRCRPDVRNSIAGPMAQALLHSDGDALKRVWSEQVGNAEDHTAASQRDVHPLIPCFLLLLQIAKCASKPFDVTHHLYTTPAIVLDRLDHIIRRPSVLDGETTAALPSETVEILKELRENIVCAQLRPAVLTQSRKRKLPEADVPVGKGSSIQLAFAYLRVHLPEEDLPAACTEDDLERVLTSSLRQRGHTAAGSVILRAACIYASGDSVSANTAQFACPTCEYALSDEVPCQRVLSRDMLALVRTTEQKLTADCAVAQKLAILRNITKIINHMDARCAALSLQSLPRLLQCLEEREKTVRLAAGEACNAILRAHQDARPGLAPTGHIGVFFEILQRRLQDQARRSAQATALSTVVSLVVVAQDQLLARGLGLLVIAMAQPGYLKALVSTHMDRVTNVRSATSFRIFQPHFNHVIPIIVRESEFDASLLDSMVTMLKMSLNSFMAMRGVTRQLLASAIQGLRADVVKLIADVTRRSIPELLLVDADAIFAPLFLGPEERLDRCTAFIFKFLQAENLNYTLGQLLATNFPSLVLEMAMQADSSETARKSFCVNLTRACSILPNESKEDVQAHLARASLTIFGMAGDILRGMRGDINCTEQARLLQGLDMLIQIIGAPIYSVAPQIMATLQYGFKDPALRTETLSLWQRFMSTLTMADVCPLLAQTTATLIQAWPTMDSDQRSIATSMLTALLSDAKQLGPAVHGVADMEGIPELHRLHKLVKSSKSQQSLHTRVEGYLNRIDTINEAVLCQALQEFGEFLSQESAAFRALASGSAFDILLGRVVHALLSSAIRSAEMESLARPLALQCLGILGALDPDRLNFPSEQNAFIPQHDLRDDDECARFALFTIESLLIKVLRSTNDPGQQNVVFAAIKGLANVCGFDSRLFKPSAVDGKANALVRSKWNGLQPKTRELLEAVIPTVIEVSHKSSSEKYLYPLYAHKASYREWLQAWTSDLIDQVVRLPTPGKIKAVHLFAPFQAAVRQGYDLSVAYFILPYLVFYAVTSGQRQFLDSVSAEVLFIINDQITPGSQTMPRESRSLCAQAIFELLDHLNTWVRSRQVFLTQRYKRSRSIEEYESFLQPIKHLETLFKLLPHDTLATAALNSKSYARALLNYEKMLYRSIPRATPTRLVELQSYWESLHLIYAELEEPDGMQGVSVSILSPSLQHQIREHEMTGRWTSAQSCWEVQLQLSPDDPTAHVGLLRCLQSLGHYDSMRTHISGLHARHRQWAGLLAPFAIESALIAGDIPALRLAVEESISATAASAFASVILALHSGDAAEFAAKKTDAAEILGNAITTASKDSYRRFYPAIVNLHVLNEFDSLARGFVTSGSQRRQHRSDVNDFEERLASTAPSFQTRETILNMRRNVYRITSGSAEPRIGSLWLSTSKIALKADHLQTAYSAILQANQLETEFAFVQSAKLYKSNNQTHRAHQELELGLGKFGVLKENPPFEKIDPVIARELAKAILKSAKWMQETGRFDERHIIFRYKRACLLAPEWEAAYYRYGQWADEQMQATGPYKGHASLGSKEFSCNLALLSQMELVMHQYSKALRYGCKFIYQALPRLLTLWLDMGAWPETVNAENEVQKSDKALKSKRVSAGKEGAKESDDPSMRQLASSFAKMLAHIRRAGEKLPGYMWLSALPQLLSRINHQNKRVRDMVSLLCEKAVKEYPQQAYWMMISALHSDDEERRRYCRILLDRVRNNSAIQGNRSVPQIGQLFGVFDVLINAFFNIAQFQVENNDALSISRNFPSLKQHVPCDIIMPFQHAMSVTFPTERQNVMTHKPFPPNLVVFHGFDDTIEIMPSVARPRKLVIKGSDGQTYRFLCKPQDDLRKDARLMECTNLMNRLLQKDAASRKRSLHIRTYAVVPLDEKTGLIEWVPETTGLRAILTKLYAPKGIQPWSDALKRIYDHLKHAQRNDLAKCGAAFRENVLPLYPPVFHEWFLDTFPEPSAWLRARTAYGRTYAVMAMVGYILGLGDRHGENILLDTTNGDCVHVDFNCLFGMGFTWFEIAEKVPFRLTQNVVDGFGVTGVEGVFRKCCEITMRILRENRTPLVSVLESFVHDPLVELGLSPPSTKRKGIGSAKGESRETHRKRVEGMRKEEARKALSTSSSKLKGTLITTNGEPLDHVISVEITVENLFKEATDEKNLGGMYVGWAPWY